MERPARRPRGKWARGGDSGGRASQMPGGLGSRLTGGGLGLFFDSRDNVFYPRRGVVADVGAFLRNRAAGRAPSTSAASRSDRSTFSSDA